MLQKMFFWLVKDLSYRVNVSEPRETTKKRNAEYWETTIKEKRARQRAAIKYLSSSANPDITNEYNVANTNPGKNTA